MICCSMTLQSGIKRERRGGHLSSEPFLLILSLCLPVLTPQVKLSACTGDPGQSVRQPCQPVFAPKRQFLCWFQRVLLAVLWLHASSVPDCKRILMLQLGDCSSICQALSGPSERSLTLQHRHIFTFTLVFSICLPAEATVSPSQQVVFVVRDAASGTCNDKLDSPQTKTSRNQLCLHKSPNDQANQTGKPPARCSFMLV